MCHAITDVMTRRIAKAKVLNKLRRSVAVSGYKVSVGDQSCVVKTLKEIRGVCRSLESNDEYPTIVLGTFTNTGFIDYDVKT